MARRIAGSIPSMSAMPPPHALFSTSPILASTPTPRQWRGVLSFNDIVDRMNVGFDRCHSRIRENRYLPSARTDECNGDVSTTIGLEGYLHRRGSVVLA